MVEEYYDGAGVLVESFVLGDCHVADAPRNDVLDFAPRNDVLEFAPRNDVEGGGALNDLEGYTLRLRFDVRDGLVLFRHFFHLC